MRTKNLTRRVQIVPIISCMHASYIVIEFMKVTGVYKLCHVCQLGKQIIYIDDVIYFLSTSSLVRK